MIAALSPKRTAEAETFQAATVKYCEVMMCCKVSHEGDAAGFEQRVRNLRSLVKTGVGPLVSSEIGGIDIKTLDRALSLKRKTLDRRVR